MGHTGGVSDPTDVLFHVVDGEVWAAAGPEYRTADFDDVGFIHLCARHQLAGVLERFYDGVAGLVILEVDPTHPGLDVVWELGVPPVGEELFPHLYGPLPRAAVRDVVPRDGAGA